MSDETLFATALEQPDPAARAAYLDSTCPDPDTRRRLDALLAAHDKAGDFLARPAVALPTPETAPTRAYAPETDHTRTHGGTVDTDTYDALGFLATPRRPDSLGRIGHYEVLEVLGRGGFGIVFRAFDDTLQRVVAVKVLAPSMAATSPARKRFLREARHAGNVRHENVVQIHDISRDEERLPYLVMEFIPGETLQQRLDRTGPLDVAEILRIGKQIAAGLASAHEMNLVHRDIKPSNILIDTGPEQRVKITDFGLARAADDASISQSGVVAGTPMYMAPEQAKGEALDHRADLFSLGSVLYVMCSGRPPFRAGSTLAVLKRVCEEQPRPIREIIPEVPDWLCRIIDKLHAKDPAERYQSAKEVADVLADCEAQLKTGAGLKDLSRIPESKPILVPTSKEVGVAWVIMAIVCVPIVVSMIVRSVIPETFDKYNQSVEGTLAFCVVALVLVALTVMRARRRLAATSAGNPAAVPSLARLRRRTRWVWTAAGLFLALAFGVKFYGHAAMLYVSNRGELLLEDMAPEMEVSVLQGGTVVHERSREWSIELPAHPATELRVFARSGGEVWRKEFAVKRGERVKINLADEQAAIEKRHRDAIDPSKLDAIARSVNELDSGGFIPLFNGKDLTGWKTHPDQPGNWTVEDGAIVVRGSRVSHLFTERGDYGGFHLRAQVRINETGDSGVWFRTPFDLPRVSTITGLRYPGGHEVQIYCRPTGDEDHKFTGSLGKEAPVLKSLHRPDEWFNLEIIARGDLLTTRVNGVKAAELRVAKDAPLRGHIALQASGSNRNTEVRFRKVEIKELPSSAPKEQWTSLFNGKDLMGWKTLPQQPGNWRVENGILVGGGLGQVSHLFTDRGDYDNFHLRAEVKINFRGAKGAYFGNSGIFFRTPFALEKGTPPVYPTGYEAQIFAGDKTPLLKGMERNRTGSLYGLKPYETIVTGADAGEWFTLEVIALGNRITIKVNGITTVDDYRDNTFQRGHIALQQVGEETTVQFRKIEIKELPSSPPTQEWVPLFNGKELTGWTGKFPNAWSVEDGILIGRGKNGSADGWSELVHPRSDFKDFHLRAQARINASGWAGIRVRKQKDSLDGYKIWLSNDPERTGARTGRLDVVGKDDALTITNPPGDLRVPVDEWFTLDLVARGPELVLSINGQEAARVNDPSFAHGEIQLEVAGAETIVQFRKIEIKELLLAPPVPFPTELDRADLAKLKGEWEAHQRVFDGKVQTLGGGKSAGIRFGDGDFEHWETEGKATRRQTGTFRVEAANKQVLLYFKDQIVPVRVAYRADGDLLRLSFAGLPGTDGKSKGPPLRAPERMTSQNNLKQISLAMHNYLDTHKALPQAAVTNVKAKDGKLLMSWRVAILPWLEQDELYKQFKLDEPWDSEHNKKLIARMPKVFAAPGIATPQPGMTHYRVFAGPGTVFEPRPGKEHGWPLTEILDGTANTLMIVEATDPIIWTKPDDLPFDQKKPLPKLGVYESATHVAMCDGKIHALVPNTPEEMIRALATRNGGERVSAPVLTPSPDQAPPFHMDLRRKGSLPAGAVVLRTFDPAKDKAIPLRGDASKIVRVEDGAWRIENSFDRSVSGNFRVALGTITEGIPEDGVLILRAKVKLKPSAENSGWGDLELNGASPSFHGYDWPDHLATYKGDISEWAEKEVRYPIEIIRKKVPPTITVHVGLHGNGVLWVKDLELLHIPAPGRAAPAPLTVPGPPVPSAAPDPVVLETLRDLIASTAKSRDLVKARFDAGTVSKIALLAAEADVVDARIRLAEAEGNRAEIVALHEVLVVHRKEERDLIALRVDAGAEAIDVLNKADARLADAKLRLAKLKPPAAAAPAPRPKP